MGKQSDRLMDSRENEALKEIIQNLEKTLRHRIVVAAKRSQETLRIESS